MPRSCGAQWQKLWFVSGCSTFQVSGPTMPSTAMLRGLVLLQLRWLTLTAYSVFGPKMPSIATLLPHPQTLFSRHWACVTAWFRDPRRIVGWPPL